MRPTILLRALPAAALLTLAARTGGAQTATPSSSAATAPSTPWAAVPVGKYHLDIQLPDHVMPATITITDSSGTPTATLLPEGDQDAHPVKVTIKNPELTVSGSADKGPFEIVLLRNGEELAGRWSYGGENGKLTGKVEH